MSWRNLPAEEEARRRELYRQGLNDEQIARVVGRSPQTIGHWRWKRGLKPNRTRMKPRNVLPGDSILHSRPEAGCLFLQAFERDLLRAMDRSHAEIPNLAAFMQAWRECRADEVLSEIEGVPE